MLCRLCFFEFNDTNAFPLFSDAGEPTSLIKLIAKYLYIEVSYDDEYTTNICFDCFQHLDEFHKFVLNVEQRQNTFKNIQTSTDNNKNVTEKFVSKSLFEEASLDLKEFLPSEENGDCAPETEFGYADENEHENGLRASESDDDDDDQPLKNLIPKVKIQITKTRTCKITKKKTKNKQRRKSKSLKLNSVKKNKTLNKDSNDSEKSLKQNRSNYTAEEDKLRDDLIEKHIPLKCEICGIKVNFYKDLKLHFRMEHNRKSFITCCNKRFSQRFLLVDHIKSHLNPDHFKCQICGKVFKSKVCVGVHMANKHSNRDEMRHACKICGKKFPHPSILVTHMLVHSQERKHVCEICKKAFKSIYMLKAHTKKIHGEKAPYVCDTCGKEYRFKLSFDRHIAEHNGQSEQREKCSICSQYFSLNYIQRHMKRHEIVDVDCEQCGKRLKSKAALASHMEYAHKARRTYACTFCDKTFERASNLKEHIDMHTGNKEYNCKYCPREFRSKANMYAHVKKKHYEEWTEVQKLRKQGPAGANDIKNEINNSLNS